MRDAAVADRAGAALVALGERLQRHAARRRAAGAPATGARVPGVVLPAREEEVVMESITGNGAGTTALLLLAACAPRRAAGTTAVFYNVASCDQISAVKFDWHSAAPISAGTFA